MRQHMWGFRLFAVIGAWGCLVATGVRGADAVSPRPAWTTSKVQGSPEPPEPYAIVPAFPGLRFEKPTCLEELPGMNRLLVTEIGGKIYSFPKDAATTQAELLLNLVDLLPEELKGRGVSL